MGSRFEIWDRRRFEDIDNKLDDAARAQAVNGLTQRGTKLSL
jgi:DNA-binding transcriptional regulator/RsmH inhibitor MraZ